MKEVAKIAKEAWTAEGLKAPISCAADVHIDTIDSLVEIAAPAIDFYNVVTEINLESNQFNPRKMYSEAQKMGLDIGDLEEYGFDYDNLNFSPDQSYVEFEQKMRLLYKNIMELLSGKI